MAGTATPSAAQQRAIEETRVLVQNYVTNALDIALSGVLRDFVNTAAAAAARSNNGSVSEGHDVGQDDLSAVLKEGSRVTKSVNASEMESSGLEYSMDFERSS